MFSRLLKKKQISFYTPLYESSIIMQSVFLDKADVHE